MVGLGVLIAVGTGSGAVAFGGGDDGRTVSLCVDISVSITDDAEAVAEGVTVAAGFVLLRGFVDAATWSAAVVGCLSVEAIIDGERGGR